MIYLDNGILFGNKKEWHLLQHWWTLKTLCYVKAARHNRPHIVRFNLYKISRIDKSQETENKSSVAREGWGEGSECESLRELWAVVEMFCILIAVMVTQLNAFVKIHRTRWVLLFYLFIFYKVSFSVCKFYLNKLDLMIGPLWDIQRSTSKNSWKSKEKTKGEKQKMKIFKKISHNWRIRIFQIERTPPGAPGWLSWKSIQLLILGVCAQAPHWV